MNLANETLEIGQLFEQIGHIEQHVSNTVEIFDSVEAIVDAIAIAQRIHEPVLEQTFAKWRVAKVYLFEECARLAAVVNVLDNLKVGQ